MVELIQAFVLVLSTCQVSIGSDQNNWEKVETSFSPTFTLRREVLSHDYVAAFSYELIKPEASTNFQVTGCNSFWKNPLFSLFSYRKAYVTMFDLAINLNRSRSTHLNKLWWTRAWCHLSSFVEIGPLVLEKKIFEGFSPYTGMVAILVMWPVSQIG